MIPLIPLGNASSPVELIELVDPLDNFRMIFRGQPSGWQLLPKAGRTEFCIGTLGEDLNRFREWREAAVAFSTLPENEWECLAIAQHHGLATRLLDWTRNLFVAAFFAAAETCPDDDGVIFCLQPPSSVDPASNIEQRENYLAEYSPRPIDERIYSQAGTFTYHGMPELPIEQYDVSHSEFAPQLFEIKIPKASKSGWLGRLDRYGVNRQTLFPGLDGLSDYTNWRVTNLRKLRRPQKS